jgi:hypothetical protein
VRHWARLKRAPGSFELELAEAAEQRHARIRARTPLESKPAVDCFSAYEIDGYLPVRMAAEAAGVSAAEAVELVASGAWTSTVLGGLIYARPAIVSMTAVETKDEAA